jgi:signal transduction histidine kinase
VTYEDDSLTLTVSNPTRHAHVENGHGIVGMRERAALLGGTLDMSAADGRFRIHARLPYGGST